MLPFMMLVLLAVALPVFAEDQLFRCEDGTFTNVRERLCKPYEPKGTVMVAPERASMASIHELLPEPEPPVPRAPATDPLPVCQLYQEWMILNVRTGGGVTFVDTDDIPRWLGLSRLFTAIGAPHCDVSVLK